MPRAGLEPATPNIIRVIKSRRIRLAVHVARMGEVRIMYNFWSENMNGIDKLEDLGLNGRVM
jgi:hypothetical protein